MAEELVIISRNMSLEERVEQQGLALLGSARALIVRDAVTFLEAVEGAKAARQQQRFVHELMDPLCEATDKAHKVATGRRGMLLKYPTDARAIYDKGASDYEQEQARLRRQAEDAARREQERLEAEERARVAAEEARLRAQAVEVRLAEAVVAEQAGDTVRVQALVEAPIVVAPVLPRAIFVAPPPVAQPKVEGVSFRDDFDFEITDAALIPREYLMPDLVRIRGVVKAMKMATNIPGIKVIPKRIAAVRA